MLFVCSMAVKEEPEKKKNTRKDKLVLTKPGVPFPNVKIYVSKDKKKFKNNPNHKKPNLMINLDKLRANQQKYMVSIFVIDKKKNMKKIVKYIEVYVQKSLISLGFNV